MQGNVALDCARILLSPIEALAKTDITQHALDALSQSKIRKVRTDLKDMCVSQLPPPMLVLAHVGRVCWSTGTAAGRIYHQGAEGDDQAGRL